KKACKGASDILLATDEDREGEMIAWSLAYVLKLKKPKRITFNSITKSEIKKAIQNPRAIDQALVDAQKTRRRLDRILGYEISPILWNNVNGDAKSAGRVQSVVVRLIIDKENEISDFLKNGINSYFKYTGEFFDTDKNTFDAQLYSYKESPNDDDDNS